MRLACTSAALSRHAGVVAAASGHAQDGNTPLFAAACNGKTECVQALLAAGANLNATLEARAMRLRLRCAHLTAKCCYSSLDNGTHDYQLKMAKLD